MVTIQYTFRSLEDIQQIKGYSSATYGNIIAKKYLAGIDSALQTISEHPGLLGKRPYSERLSFYIANKHTLVFTTIEQTPYLLTVKHSRMNLEKLLPTLEPTLLAEAEALYQQIANR